MSLEQLRRRAGHLLRSIDNQLAELSSHDYPTQSPLKFIQFLQSVSLGLQKAAAEINTPPTLQYICQFAKDFCQDIRILTSASYPQIPWAMIRPMEQLISTIAPGTQVVLRSQWAWNYMVRPISLQYREALGALPPHYFDESQLFDEKTIWSIISLPMADKNHVLMHVILGHEIGHAIAFEFLSSEDTKMVEKEISTLSR